MTRRQIQQNLKPTQKDSYITYEWNDKVLLSLRYKKITQPLFRKTLKEHTQKQCRENMRWILLAPQ